MLRCKIYYNKEKYILRFHVLHKNMSYVYNWKEKI